MKIKYIMYNFQYYSVLYENAVRQVGILLTCMKHLHDRIISPRGEAWAHKTSLTPPLLLKRMYLAMKLNSHVYVC